MTKSGKYIVIEGTDATGKSTQVEKIVARLQQIGIEAIQFHEPDGVEIAHQLRKIIKNGELKRSALTNVLLFTAVRRENWLQLGRVALKRGQWIVSARNHLSTLVYQAYAEGLNLNQPLAQDIAFIENLTLLATDPKYLNPDCQIILDINDEAERARRIAQRGELKNPDTFEARDHDFQQRVIDGYRQIAAQKQLPIVAANQTRQEISQQIWQILARKVF